MRVAVDIAVRLPEIAAGDSGVMKSSDVHVLKRARHCPRQKLRDDVTDRSSKFDVVRSGARHPKFVQIRWRNVQNFRGDIDVAELLVLSVEVAEVFRQFGSEFGSHSRLVEKMARSSREWLAMNRIFSMFAPQGF